MSRALLSGWIARIGYPQTRHTNDGSSRRRYSTVRRKCVVSISAGRLPNPAAKGLVISLHRELKSAITCHADDQWTASLPLVLLGIRTAYKEELLSSVPELVYVLYQPPRRSRHPPSYSGSAATWTSCDRPHQHAMQPRPHSPTSISGTRPTCSCGRTPHDAHWSYHRAGRTN